VKLYAKNFISEPVGTVIQQRRDISDNLQNNKHNEAIEAASSSINLTSFFKESSVGKKEILWRPQKKYSHTATLNTTCSSVLLTGRRN
jgi:hypothetical protein